MIYILIYCPPIAFEINILYISFVHLLDLKSHRNAVLGRQFCRVPAQLLPNQGGGKQVKQRNKKHKNVNYKLVSPEHNLLQY